MPCLVDIQGGLPFSEKKGKRGRRGEVRKGTGRRGKRKNFDQDVKTKTKAKQNNPLQLSVTPVSEDLAPHVLNKVEDENQLPRLASDLHMCISVHTHHTLYTWTHTQIFF